jgi:DNA polymerase I-like protein with 3'-5' exonuclease and polymerase domains
VPFDLWRPSNLLNGTCVALDCETALIKPGTVPPLVIASATDGQRGFFIARQHLPVFLNAHAHHSFVLHNAAFDLAVIDQAGCDTASLVATRRVFDTGLLYKLLKLANEGTCHGPWSLDHVCQELLGITLPKDGLSSDGQSIRTTYARFLKADDTPDYPALLRPEYRAYLDYAGADAVATLLVSDDLNKHAQRLFGTLSINIFDPSTYGAAGVHDGVSLAPVWWQHGFLSHGIQLKASIALAAIERNGMHPDVKKIQTVVGRLDAELIQVKAELQAHHWVPGAGSHTVLDRILAAEERKLDVTFMRTDTGAYSRCAQHLEEYRGRSRFIDLYLSHEELNKVRTVFMSPLTKADGVVRCRFNVLVNTGRTSCGGSRNEDGERNGLNLQNLPRGGEVRECLLPSPGHLLLACDYSTIELVTLAQHALKKYGASRMAEAIKKNADLHCVYAAHRQNINISGLPSWDKKTLMPLLGADADKLRDRAKPVNFGYPGGLGAEALVEYARTTYGVALSIEEAKQEKEHWLRSWPEMSLHLASNDFQTMATQFRHLWQTYPDLKYALSPSDIPWPLYILRGVLCGRSTTSTSKRSYRQTEIDWAWASAEQIAQHVPHLTAQQRVGIQTRIRERIADDDLWCTLSPRQRFVSTLTGRLRGHPTYSAARNCVFQGLAADGAKLALYRLHCEGFRVVNFIHDEVLVELPIQADHRALAERVQTIMKEEMGVVVPDLPVSCEFALMRRWYKGAKALYDGDKLLPVKPVTTSQGTRWVHDEGIIMEEIPPHPPELSQAALGGIA